MAWKDVILEGGVGEVGGEGEGLGGLAWSVMENASQTHLIKAMEIGVEDEALLLRSMLLWRGSNLW